jgi:hypothetical protein
MAKRKYTDADKAFSSARSDAYKRIDKKHKNIIYDKNKKVEDFYNKSQKLIKDKNKLDVDYLLGNVKRDIYVKKAKELNSKKDKLVSEIQEYKRERGIE